MQGRLDSMSSVVESQQRKLGVMRQAISLKGLWASIVLPYMNGTVKNCMKDSPNELKCSTMDNGSNIEGINRDDNKRTKVVNGFEKCNDESVAIALAILSTHFVTLLNNETSQSCTKNVNKNPVSDLTLSSTLNTSILIDKLLREVSNVDRKLQGKYEKIIKECRSLRKEKDNIIKELTANKLVVVEMENQIAQLHFQICEMTVENESRKGINVERVITEPFEMLCEDFRSTARLVTI